MLYYHIHLNVVPPPFVRKPLRYIYRCIDEKRTSYIDERVRDRRCWKPWYIWSLKMEALDKGLGIMFAYIPLSPVQRMEDLPIFWYINLYGKNQHSLCLWWITITKGRWPQRLHKVNLLLQLFPLGCSFISNDGRFRETYVSKFLHFCNCWIKDQLVWWHHS